MWGGGGERHVGGKDPTRQAVVSSALEWMNLGGWGG